jgi:hypothetical protein
MDPPHSFKIRPERDKYKYKPIKVQEECFFKETFVKACDGLEELE